MPVSIHHNDSDAGFQAQLNALVQEAFGFSFAPWFERGLWPEAFTCYSILEDGVMLANAAAYLMDLLVEGQRQSVVQVGTVATRKDRQGKGLSRQVIEAILDRHAGEPLILFAHPGVVDFYPRFGFRLVGDRQPLLRIADFPGWAAGRGQTVVHLEKANPDDPRVQSALHERGAFSQVLDCLDAAPVNAFHLLLNFPDRIYAIPELNSVVVAGQEGSTLNLYDVVTRSRLDFTQLAPALASSFPGVKTIRFGFNPDWLGVDYEMVDYEDHLLFVRGALKLPERFIFPFLGRT